MVNGLKDAQAAKEMRPRPSEAHPRLYSIAYYLGLRYEEGGFEENDEDQIKVTLRKFILLRREDRSVTMLRLLKMSSQ